MRTNHLFRLRVFPAFSSFLLAFLFIYAAASKLSGFSEFQSQLLNQNLPREVSLSLAYLLPLAELAAVALLLFRRDHPAGPALCFCLLFLFTGYTGLVTFGFWERVPCSCGGILSHMSWKTHFFFNLFFLLLSGAAWLQAAGLARDNRQKTPDY